MYYFTFIQFQKIKLLKSKHIIRQYDKIREVVELHFL